MRPMNSVRKLRILSGERRTDHSMSDVAAPVATIPESVRQFKALSLRANFSWTFVGNVVYSACQWGMLAVIAKLGSPEAVGRFALGLAITAPVIMFANLQLRVVQATDARRHYRFGDYLGLRLIMTWLALIVIAGIALFSGYKQETVLVVCIVGLSKAFEAVSDVLFGLLQQRERMDRIAISLIVKGVFSVVALGVMYQVTGSLVWGLASLTVVWAAVLVGYDVPNTRLMLRTPDTGLADLHFDTPVVDQAFRPHWDKRILINLARLALPLGFVMLLVSLNVNIPRYFLEHYRGERELGIFAALAYMMVAGRTVMFALGWAASPRLATYYATRDLRSFRNLLVKLSGIGLLLGTSAVLVVVVAGRTILTLLYGPEYAEHVDLFIWLTVAAGIGYVASLVGYGITAAQYFKSQLCLFVLIAIATVLASVLLIPSQGLQGAAMTLLVAALIELFGSVPIILYAMHKLSQRREEHLTMSLELPKVSIPRRRAVAQERISIPRRRAAVRERISIPRRRAVVREHISINVAQLLLFCIGGLLPLISLRRGLGGAYAPLDQRIALVDLLVVFFLATILVPRGLRIHAIGGVYGLAVLLSLSVGLLRESSGEFSSVMTGFFAIAMAFLYWVLGHNLGRYPALLRFLFLGIAFGVAWEAIVVLHDYFSVPQWFVDEMPGRVRGTFRASGQLGAFGFSTAGLSFAIGWSLFKRRYVRGLIVIIGMIGIFFVWAASRRSALFALALWAVIACTLEYKRLRDFRYFAFSLAVTVALILIVVFAIHHTDAFAVRRITEAVSSMETGNSFIRLQWNSVVAHFSEWFPQGLGWGRGQIVDYSQYHEIHNGHLALFVEGGLLGLLAFYGVVALSIFRPWSATPDSKLVHNLVLACILAAIVMMIHNTLHRDRGFMLLLGISSQLYWPDTAEKPGCGL